MRWLRSPLAAAAVLVLAGAIVVAQPRPDSARADLPCSVSTGGLGVIGGLAEDVTGGAIGAGNPLGDLCSKVTGKVAGAITSPVTSALKGVGDDVFEEMTKWVAQGAGWLMGQVVGAVDSSTTPHLRQAGFLSEYAKMSAIAVLLGVAALLAAMLQGIAQGNAGLLLRVVLVNTPLAFVGTSVAFVVVQLLVGATDSLCHAISAGTGNHGSQLFEAAIRDLGKVGGEVGEAPTGGGISGAIGHNSGQATTPLFVGFLLAIVGALAALCVLFEFLLRDAGIYAVSLFMPFALYASISPRWRGVMRKYAEALFALIESKFIIVAVITLAATLVAKEDTSVEVVLVASALMALACFAPFFLFRIVAVSEGAAAASFGRRSAGGAIVGGASRTAHTARSVASMASSGGGAGGGGSGVRLWSASELAGRQPKPPTAPGGGDGSSKPGPGGDRGGAGGSGRSSEGPARPSTGAPPASSSSSGGTGSGKTGAGQGTGGAAATGGGGAAAAGVAAAKAPQKGADRLSDTGAARSAGKSAGGAGATGDGGGSEKRGAGGGGGREDSNDGGGGSTSGAGGSAERRPRPESSSATGEGAGSRGDAPSRQPSDRPPRPPSQRPDGPETVDPGGES
jgi:hypothetical protein